MYRLLYVLPLACFLACGNPPRALEEIDQSSAKPTGVVDSVSAAQIVVDNIAKDELFESVATKNSRLPTGFIVGPRETWLPTFDFEPARAEETVPAGSVRVPDFYELACHGVERNMKAVTDNVDLKADGGSGTLSVTVQCNDQHYFTMTVTMGAACAKSWCFEGSSRYELKDGKLIWALRATVKPAAGGTSHDVDMGGTLKVGIVPLSDVKLLGFFKTIGKDGKPAGDAKPVILSWSPAPGVGIGKYSEYYLTGAGGKYRCNTPDSGKTGCCRLLGANDSPTGEQFTWGTGGTCG
ncbi:MAG: hypothetical protein IT381_02595 [Deltaproteobacteria bacterium]|nr:hypothetical protein [Deltaproteobacteria bacterium]